MYVSLTKTSIPKTAVTKVTMTKTATKSTWSTRNSYKRTLLSALTWKPKSLLKAATNPKLAGWVLLKTR